jgi:hypothetical protein
VSVLPSNTCTVLSRSTAACSAGAASTLLGAAPARPSQPAKPARWPVACPTGLLRVEIAYSPPPLAGSLTISASTGCVVSSATQDAGTSTSQPLVAACCTRSRTLDWASTAASTCATVPRSARHSVWPDSAAAAMAESAECAGVPAGPNTWSSSRCAPAAARCRL